MRARVLLRIILSIEITMAGAPWAEEAARAEGSATLDAPASAAAGSDIHVRWTGPHRRWDRIGVVKVGTPDSVSNSGFSAPVVCCP